MKRTIVLLTLALALVACSSGKKIVESTSAATTTTTTEAPKATDAPTTTEAPAPASSGSTDSAACETSMRAYHDALVSTHDNIDDEAPYQNATLAACTHDQWLAAVEPYTGQADTDIAFRGPEGQVGPEKVLSAFCSPTEPKPKACQ